MSIQRPPSVRYHLLKHSEIQCQGMYYTYFFFSWNIISFLTTVLFFSPANAPVRDLATSMGKCQTVGKKPNHSLNCTPRRKKDSCLLWKLRHHSVTDAYSFIKEQKSRTVYLFSSAHLSPSPLNKFFHLLLIDLIKIGPG